MTNCTSYGVKGRSWSLLLLPPSSSTSSSSLLYHYHHQIIISIIIVITIIIIIIVTITNTIMTIVITITIFIILDNIYLTQTMDQTLLQVWFWILRVIRDSVSLINHLLAHLSFLNFLSSINSFFCSRTKYVCVYGSLEWHILSVSFAVSRPDTLAKCSGSSKPTGLFHSYDLIRINGF